MIKPVRFRECNTTLTGEGCGILPAIRTEDGYFVSRWSVSLTDRVRILFRGTLYLSIKGCSHPPVLLMTKRPFYMKDGGRT